MFSLVASAAVLSVPSIAAASDPAPAAEVKRPAEAGARPVKTRASGHAVTKGSELLKSILESLDQRHKQEASPFEPPGQPPGRPPDPPGHNDPPNPPGKPPDRPPNNSNSGGNK